MADKTGGGFFKKLFDKGSKENPVKEYPIEDIGMTKGWNNVGKIDFEETNSTKYGLARTHEFDFKLDKNGYPYLAFLGQRLEVRKYNGKVWEYLEKNSNLILTDMRLTINSNGMPYLFAPTRTGGRQQGTILKYEDKKWEVFAQTNGGQVIFPNAASDDAGSVYFAYVDVAYSNRIAVTKYDGANWKNIGAPGFPRDLGSAHGLSYVLDDQGNQYVAFYAYNPFNSGRVDSGAHAVVMKFDGNDWVTVGEPYFSEGYVNQISLAVDSKGIPYVAFCDGAHSEKATVMRFVDNKWTVVGKSAFSDGRVYHINIVVDSNGVPYVAYSDYANDKKATVMFFDGNEWKPLGDKSISKGEAKEVKLLIDKQDRLYVAYLDVALGSDPTVKRFIR